MEIKIVEGEKIAEWRKGSFYSKKANAQAVADEIDRIGEGASRREILD